MDEDEDDYDVSILAKAAASAASALASKDDVFIPFINKDDQEIEDDIRNLVDITEVPLPQSNPGISGSVVAPVMAAISAEVSVKLPPHWRTARDESGRLYFFNKKTKQVSWDPPEAEASNSLVEVRDIFAEVETASTGSENEDEEKLDEEEGEDTDDEEEDDSDKEEDNLKMALDPHLMESASEIVSDLSEEQKELLLKSSRKKSKEERQNERRQKREQNREKREYEKKRRRERHGKHRRDGLVQEYIIPVRKFHFANLFEFEFRGLFFFAKFQARNDRDKSETFMTFEEMRMRLVNRDAIREKQEEEERAEDLREMEEAARQRQLEKKRLQGEVQGKAALASLATAADTETERKFKAAFLKEISKVVVKVLEEYRNTETSKIKTKEDFKNLAKKVLAKNKMESQVSLDLIVFLNYSCLIKSWLER